MKSRVKELLHALAMGRRDGVDELADLLCGDNDVQSADEVYARVVEVPVVEQPPKATDKKAK